MNVTISQLPPVNPGDDDFLVVEKSGRALTGRTTIGDFISFQGILTEESDFNSLGIITTTTPPEGSVQKEITGSFSAGEHGFIKLTASTPVNVSTISTSKTEGFELTLMVNPGSENMVTLTTDVGNMLLNGDFTFDSSTSLIRLLYTGGKWVELFRSGR